MGRSEWFVAGLLVGAGTFVVIDQVAGDPRNETIEALTAQLNETVAATEEYRGVVNVRFDLFDQCMAGLDEAVRLLEQYQPQGEPR